VLIGASGQKGAFSEDVIRTIAASVDRPVVLPLSNPTDISEATPADIYAWTEGRALVATGSPFDDVMIGKRRVKVAQGNNAFIFPGIGLGALQAGARRISDGMFHAAATALAHAVTEAELESGMLYPSIGRLHEVSTDVAHAVILDAVDTQLVDAMTEADIGDIKLLTGFSRLASAARILRAVQYQGAILWRKVSASLCLTLLFGCLWHFQRAAAGLSIRPTARPKTGWHH
jgi:malate dehydrogenase (oxaloacetate-decarboxylating)